MENEEKQLLTLQQVAKRLVVSERTIHRYLESGEISGMFVARQWRFTEEDITNYEQSKRRKIGKGAKKKRAYTKKSKS